MTSTTTPRVAVLSVHTSPIDQPGIGDSGGMNVSIRAVAERLAAKGVEVDLFTRCRGGDDHETKIAPSGDPRRQHQGGTVLGGPEGRPASVPAGVPGRGRCGARTRTAAATTSCTATTGCPAGSGARTKELWDAPLVTSFHTLGKVKNYSLARGETPEPEVRLAGEQRVIAEADRILAPTPLEAGQLVGLYRADPDKIRVVPPGVDHTIFTPRSTATRRVSGCT